MRRSIGVAATGLLFACGGNNAVSSTSTRAALTAQCASSESIPSSAWRCPDSLTIQCGDPTPTLYVPTTVASCMGQTLTVSEQEPFSVGTHSIEVKNSQGTVLCSAQLTVEGGSNQPPTLQSHTIFLWPPNHKFHEVSVSDCVGAVDSCGGDIQGEFIWASSDEPADDIGDGHFAPDIGLGRDAQHACVRAERQGPRNGRVYKLGVRVTDGSGNTVESECTVIVDHDQRGTVGQDSGEAYRLTLDPTQPGLDCGSGGPTGTGGHSGSAGMGAGGTTGSGGNGGTGGGDTGGTGGSDTGGTGGSDNGGTGGEVNPF